MPIGPVKAFDEFALLRAEAIRIQMPPLPLIDGEGLVLWDAITMKLPCE